jgi:hypothetical protein
MMDNLVLVIELQDNCSIKGDANANMFSAMVLAFDGLQSAS